MPGPDRYLLGEDEASLPRYRLFDQVYRRGTERAFASVDVARDAAVLEVGCGIGLTACWIAETIVPDGRVFAFDRSADLVGLARDEAAARGLDNIEFATLDAEHLTPDVAAGPFDVAHSRYVLSYLPKADDVVRRIATLLAPAGVLLAEEIGQSYVTHNPPRWLLDQLSWFQRLIELGGGDPNYGWDALPGHADAAGLRVESVWAYSPCEQPEALAEMLRLSLSREMKTHLVDNGIATAEHVDANAAAMTEPLGDAIISGTAAVSVTARKPAASAGEPAAVDR